METRIAYINQHQAPQRLPRHTCVFPLLWKDGALSKSASEVSSPTTSVMCACCWIAPRTCSSTCKTYQRPITLQELEKKLTVLCAPISRPSPSPFEWCHSPAADTGSSGRRYAGVAKPAHLYNTRSSAPVATSAKPSSRRRRATWTVYGTREGGDENGDGRSIGVDVEAISGDAKTGSGLAGVLSAAGALGFLIDSG